MYDFVIISIPTVLSPYKVYIRAEHYEERLLAIMFGLNVNYTTTKLRYTDGQYYVFALPMVLALISRFV